MRVIPDIVLSEKRDDYLTQCNTFNGQGTYLVEPIYSNLHMLYLHPTTDGESNLLWFPDSEANVRLLILPSGIRNTGTCYSVGWTKNRMS